MFKINRLRLEIKSTDEFLYGFDIPFQSGLNIIAGQNSKGKSTIGSCIYYALGMEELLGTGVKNESALGKALRTSFDFYPIDGSEEISKKVLLSTLFLEIENDRDEKVTIKRYINSGESDGNGDLKTKTIWILESDIENKHDSKSVLPLYLRNHNNNTNEFGFYYWFSSFIGLDIPDVICNSKNDTIIRPLYLQTIFSSCFIEQTKGWSDFFASMPYFGITKNKEKVFEFLLNLNELSIALTKDDIEKREKSLKSKWERKIDRCNILASEYNAVFNNGLDGITSDIKAIDLLNLMVRDPFEPTSILPLKTKLSELQIEVQMLNQSPVLTVEQNKEYIRAKLEELYDEKIKFSEQFDGFNLKLNLQKSQLSILKDHLQNVSKELVSQKGIQNIINDAIVVEDVYNKCPTCKQSVSDDLMAQEGVTIEKLSLEENITYLTGQQKIILSSIDSLNKVIDEKEIIKKYYLKKQRDLEEQIKTILRELVSDDRDYSDTDSLKRVNLEKSLNEFEYLNNRFHSLISELKEIAKSYEELLKEKAELNVNSAADNLKISSFETCFRIDFLQAFKYRSNKVWNVFVQKEEPFKYFPVFKYNEKDDLPQSIKTNSSASDFVRVIWAYSLALLNIASNHPGLVVFDEPGQHSVSSDSLKVLFEKCSNFNQKQIILFTSIQKVLIKDGEKDIDKLDLDLLLTDLDPDDYNIYKIDDHGKSISILSDLY